jgi:hypothetical protein
MSGFLSKNLSWMLLGSCVLAILVSVYIYAFRQDYTYVVEAACDPALDRCFTRDCEEEECPPNEFSEYKLFSVPASVFPSCTDNACSNMCGSVSSSCEEIMCAEGESCRGPERSII